MVCGKCGAKLRDGARFCNQCGAQVTNGLRPCPHCAVLQRKEARYCKACGKALSVVEIKQGCVHCGKVARPGARICSKCGKPIDGILCPRCKRPNRLAAKFCAHCGTDMRKPADEYPYETGKVPINSTLNGRYLVIRLIKQGGMSAIYMVKDIKAPDQVYAAKEMSFSMLKESDAGGNTSQYTVDDYKHLFRQEYEILHQSRHTNLPRVIDLFESGGRPYFIMEFINGDTLEEKLMNLPEGEFLPEQVVLEWARQICDVLDYLHHCEPPIIYRDLKPGNLMIVSGSDQIKLIDFGIARFFKPHQKKDTFIFGTPGYAPPELYVRSERMQTGAYSDIYSLGATLHHLLTRRDPSLQPFQFIPVRLINPSVSRKFSDAIQKAVQYQPEQRQQSVLEFFKDVFGNDAEFTREPSSAGPVEPPIHNPQQLDSAARPSQPIPPPVVVVNPPIVNEPNLIVSDHSVDFGEFAYGTRPFESILAVTIKDGSTGVASFDQKWFQAHPSQWNGSTFLQLSIDITQIPQATWRRGDTMVYFGNAPHWLQEWAGWHAARMVPAPADCSGQLTIRVRQVEEKIALHGKAMPGPGKTENGWAKVLVCMIAEAIFGLVVVGLALGAIIG